MLVLLDELARLARPCLPLVPCIIFAWQATDIHRIEVLLRETMIDYTRLGIDRSERVVAVVMMMREAVIRLGCIWVVWGGWNCAEMVEEWTRVQVDGHGRIKCRCGVVWKRGIDDDDGTWTGESDHSWRRTTETKRMGEEGELGLGCWWR